MGNIAQPAEDAATCRTTYFAPAERTPPPELASSIELISKNPLIDTLLTSVGGLLAILNEQRQIVAVNDALLKSMGVANADELFGLRPGEAIGCVHARDMPDGCGTSKFCSTCGAAVAIVSSLCTDQPVEQDCAATVERKGKPEDLYFRVRAHAVTIEGCRFILLFLQDLTDHQRRTTLERVFLHDISNLVGGLVGSAELLNSSGKQDCAAKAEQMLQLSLRLAKELEIHRAILGSVPAEIRLMPEDVWAADVGEEIKQVFLNHPVAKAKHFELSHLSPDRRIETDRSLLIRVLANAVTNAFEATAEAATVRLWHETTETGVMFCVWNREAIPEPVALRMFQRSFTTRKAPGRGIGTYVMKLLAERYLGGEVDFSTSEQDGTVFRVSLPDRLAS